MSSLDLLIDAESGIWHLANRGFASWSDFAVMAARRCGLDTTLIDAVEGSELGHVAPRPGRVVLDSERGTIMPTLGDALARYLVEREPDVLPPAESASDLTPLRASPRGAQVS
jgi:dTDP-4-dehydrorhamnose reductase